MEIASNHIISFKYLLWEITPFAISSLHLPSWCIYKNAQYFAETSHVHWESSIWPLSVDWAQTTKQLCIFTAKCCHALPWERAQGECCTSLSWAPQVPNHDICSYKNAQWYWETRQYPLRVLVSSNFFGWTMILKTIVYFYSSKLWCAALGRGFKCDIVTLMASPCAESGCM